MTPPHRSLRPTFNSRSGAALLLGALAALAAACGPTHLANDGGSDAGPSDGGLIAPVDGGQPSADGGTNPGPTHDGGACMNDSHCPLAHRCVLGVCRAHRGGTGTPCPNGDECAVDALCTGTAFSSTGPICIRACDGTTCPGDYTCQFFDRVRDGGTTTVSVCLPRNAFGTPCGNEDLPHDCTTPGQYCGARSREVGAVFNTGYCTEGDDCDFATQTGCAPSETCVPAGAAGYDNNRATVCVEASPSGGGQGEPCPCHPHHRCVQLSSRHAVCLRYCTPNDANHSCAGVPALDPAIACATGNHPPLLCPDGGAPSDGGPLGDARCFDLLSGAPAALGSLPAGVCR